MEAKRGLDDADFANRAAANDFGDPGGLRMAAIHEGLHKKDACFARGFRHDHRLGVIERDRLFAKDVLARARGRDAPLRMLRMRRGDVDRVDAGIG